jgi:hypothetical protein
VGESTAAAGASPGTGAQGAGAPPPTSCTAGKKDCNGDLADGCEVDIETDAEHCGACGTPCSAAGTWARACTAGACKPTCDAYHVDCNRDGHDGCESYPPSDPHNCGTCGTDCHGGACNAGKCEPAELATDLDTPTHIAVDASYVYWVESPAAPKQATLRRASLDGEGRVTVFATDRGIADLKTSGTFAYFAEGPSAGATTADGTIRRVTSGSSSVQTVLTGIFAMRLAVTDSDIYWADRTLHRRSIADGTSADVSPADVTPYSLISDGKNVYGMTTYSGLIGVVGGTFVTTGATDTGSGESAAVDGGHVYAWFVRDGAYVLGSWAKDLTGEPLALFTAAEDSSAPANGLAVSGAHVYFAESDALYAVPSAGGQSSLVVSTHGAARELVAHDGVLYWIESGAGGSAVRKLAVL